MTTSPPGAASPADQGDPDRVRIRDAMHRLLAGAPLHSDGKLTIKSLAAEAGIKRWLLTHKHTDLQDEFRARVVQQDRTPHARKAVQADNQALHDRITELSGQLAIERETVKRLERVVHVLTLQAQQHDKTPPGTTQLRGVR